MIHDWQNHLARTLMSGFATATLEQQLDVLLTWLGNPDNLHVADLDAAIAASGLARDEATERAYDILDGLLFADPTGPPHLILGLPPTADAATVKQRYRRLIQAYHPDRHPALAVLHNQRTEQINLAYAAFERGDWKAAAPARGSASRPSSGSGSGRATKRSSERSSGRSTGRSSGRPSGPSAKVPRPRAPKVAKPLSLGLSLEKVSLGNRLRRNLGRAETFQWRFFAGLVLFCIALLALLLYPEAPPPRPSSAPDTKASLASPAQPTAGNALDTLSAAVSVAPAPAMSPGPPEPPEPPPRVEPPAVNAQRPVRDEQAALVVAASSAELPRRFAEASRFPGPPSAQIAVSPLPVLDPASDPTPALMPDSAAAATVPVTEGQAVTAGDPLDPPRSSTSSALKLMLAREIERQLLLSDLEAERHSDVASSTATRPAPAAQDIGSRTKTPSPPANLQASALAPITPLGPAKPAPLPDTLTSAGAPAQSSGSKGKATTTGCDSVVGVLERFGMAYDAGSLDVLMALYAEDARERGVQGRPGIRRLYARLFETTFERRISFFGAKARVAEHGQCGLRARFRVTYQTSDGRPVEQAGTIDVLLDRDSPAARIQSISY